MSNESERLDPLVPDPLEVMRERQRSPELAAILAWLVPGSGHLYAGFKVKGVGALVLVLGLFMSGLLLSKGEAVSLRKEGGHEYAFLAQIGAGLPTFLGLSYTHEKIPGFKPAAIDVQDPEYTKRLPSNDTGLLFTMIAGLLNLLLIHDVLNGSPGAIQRRVEEERRNRRLQQLEAELLAERAGAGEAA